MKWMNKLERKFGKYAIPNLMFYVIILYVVGLLVSIVTPGFYEQYLCLDAEMILQGQVWRLVTFLIQPPPSNLIFMILQVKSQGKSQNVMQYTIPLFRME